MNKIKIYFALDTCLSLILLRADSLRQLAVLTDGHNNLIRNFSVN